MIMVLYCYLSGAVATFAAALILAYDVDIGEVVAGAILWPVCCPVWIYVGIYERLHR